MARDIDWDTIRAEYEAGASQASLAKKHGVSRGAIQKHIAAEGWVVSDAAIQARCDQIAEQERARLERKALQSKAVKASAAASAEIKNAKSRGKAIRLAERSGTKIVYVIESSHGGESWQKIGVATNLKARLAVMRTSSPLPVEVLMSFLSEKALVDEAILHSMHRDKRISGEWFKLSPPDIESIERYFRGKVDA